MNPHENILDIPKLTARQELRFWSQLIPGDGCWTWSGKVQHSVIKSGRRPVFSINGIWYIAARVAWRQYTGNDPGDYCVCHNCPGGDNQYCLRKEHLWLGTHQANMVDAGRKGVMTRHNLPFKIPKEDYPIIIERYRSGETQTDIAKSYNVTQGCIEHIVNERFTCYKIQN
jgi:hypothetical protein